MPVQKNDKKSCSRTGESLIHRLQEEQFERFRRVGDLWGAQLADWEDLARAEDAVRREYSGRYLFELVQNASDAIANGIAQNRISPEEGWVRIWLTPRSLLVANTGMPFEENDVRAICRLHVTTKSLSKQIGHKGVGFKSVLEITESPEVYSLWYMFGFDRREVIKRLRKITGADNIPETSVPLLRVPSARKLEYLPYDEQEAIKQMLDEGYVTVIRLPLASESLVASVEEKMRAELNGELLLFLEPVTQLAVRYPSGEDIAFWREETPLPEPGCKEVLLWYQEGNAPGHLASRWLVITRQPLEIPDRQFVEGLGDAWKEVRSVRCMAAFPLSADGQRLNTERGPENFYVYFPTEEPCGLRFLVNADFYIETARRDVRRNRLNDWLAEELAFMVADLGVRVLRLKFPDDPAIVDILAPEEHYGRAFGEYFLEKYFSALSKSPFVPLGNGLYKSPKEVCLPPEGSDSALFRELFPPERTHARARWAFPLLEVEKRERSRYPPFLRAIGLRELEIQDFREIVRDGPPIPIERQEAFLRLLAHWWDHLGYKKRNELVQTLRDCPVVPTFSGWKQPSQCLIFQANLREKEDIAVPRGFQFEMIPLEAYGDERSYDGVRARFLTTLGVKPYEAREILRSAILPILCDPKRFEALSRNFPEAIYDAYAFLKRYYDQGGSIELVRADLPKVPVPAYRLKDPARREWQPAGQVYFSSYWTQNEALEILYGQFDDVYFLGQIEEIPELQDPERRRAWYGFFAWLGVSPKPRVIGNQESWDWWDARFYHPFRSRPLWADYIQDYEQAFQCTNPHKDHGRSRLMRGNWAIDRLEEIVQVGDVYVLRHLFHTLGLYWKEYENYLTTKMTCKYTTTGCQGQTIPSYLMYCLRQMAWIPVSMGGSLDAHPRKPHQIWRLSEAVPRVVQQMLPMLPEEFQHESYRAIRSALLREWDSMQDYLALLNSLPEQYPLNPPGLEGVELQKWQEAIRSLFNWISQALQNSLARPGSSWTQRPVSLKVLAYLGDVPHYVDVEDPALVYPDDPFLAAVWRGELFYLQIDEDWASLREWLGVGKLSERVRREILSPDESATDSERMQQQLQGVWPYLLALVHEHQPSRLERVIGRLQRLRVHVVEDLKIRQEIPGLDIPPKEVAEQACLEPRDEQNPDGPGIIRTGDLFITRAALRNPDILGGLIANYIEIPRLGDAFTILYERQHHKDRMRYLESHGISEEHFRRISQQIGISDIVSHPETYDLSEIVQKVGGQAAEIPPASLPLVSSPPPPEPSREELIQEGPIDEMGREFIRESRELPPLRTDSSICVQIYQVPETPPHSSEERRIRSHPETARTEHLSFSSEEERVALGRRGEKWAYAAERQRLASMGLDPDRLEREGRLEWVSQRFPTAPYDIRSVDFAGDQLQEVFIEVKATSGNSRTAQWTRDEFLFALSKGEQYWIYWVTNADSEEPDPPLCFKNPIRLWQEGYIELELRQLEIRFL